MHRHPGIAHVGRQLRLGLTLAHLREKLVGVRVGGNVEVDRQRRLPVIRVDRIHVVHVVDARHLLLDRRRHGLFDGQCISPGVAAVDLDLRRNDVRKLGNG